MIAPLALSRVGPLRGQLFTAAGFKN